MAKKAKIKTVDRAASKSHIYRAVFGDAGTVEASAATMFPQWESFNEMQKGMIFNGLTQKLNDSHAGAENPKEAYQWTKETMEMLQSGKWTVRVPGEGGPRGGDFYRAFAEFRNITEAEAREKIADRITDLIEENDDWTEKKAFAAIKAAVLKKYPEIQEILNRMKAEKIEKTTTVDVDL